MGLTENQKLMIQAIVQNDMRSAKKCAIACIAEDNTQKNSAWCRRYKSILESSGANMLELPANLKSIIFVEDVSNSFKENRYYLSDKEKELCEKIFSTKAVCGRLMEMGIPYLNTTLLYGESGTGKTSFGRFVAYKAGLPFCYLNFSNLLDSYLGNTSKNISKAFSYEEEYPCVLMLDEIDCISIRRSNARDSADVDGEIARATITLMQEFDRLPNDAIVIGATNRMDRMDEALLRRFTIKHEVKRLDEYQRREMASKFFEDIGVAFELACEIQKLSKPDDTQSGLMNRMVEVLVQHLLAN